MPRVAALTIYPLKSATGIDVEAIELDEFGAVGDRRWLLVDESGQAITARDNPRLLRIVPSVNDSDRDGALTLAAVGHRSITVHVPDQHADRSPVQVWDDRVIARVAVADASAWCSKVIDQPCTLVRVAPETQRPLAPRFAGPLEYRGRHVAFTDGAPLLVLGLASIAALNERLVEQGEDTMMERRRFRANVWLDGTAPHEEDTWRNAQIGEVDVGFGTRCARCVLTTVNPDTLERGVEPLRTLARYRRENGGVVFGVNTTHADPGWIRVGDVVTVGESRDGVLPQ